MPYLICVFRQCDALDFASTLGIKKTNLDLRRVRREEREIGPFPIPDRAMRGRASFFDSAAGDVRHSQCILYVRAETAFDHYL
jgi:hypothetical protein